MKIFLSATLLLSVLLAMVEGGSSSFLRDVAKQGGASPSSQKPQQKLNDALLAKAVPLDEYRATLKEQGMYLPMDKEEEEARRRLEDNNGNVKYYYYSSNGGDAQVQYYNKYQNGNDDQNNQANQDDYYVNEDNYLDFDGYSLKYAKCQPVQRFSEDAVDAGEYSPMVVNDIVILRLCPSYYCSSSRDYGCLYDYAEYAMGLTDYVRIMLRYQMDKEDQLCDWCQNCVAERRRRRAANYYYDDAYNYNAGDDAYAAYAGDDANAAAGDDAAAQVDDYNYNYAGDDANAAAAGDDAAAAGDDAYAEAQYPEGCEDYETYCLDDYGYSVCDEEDNADAGDDGQAAALTAEEYLDIIGCTQVDGGYFVRPRCDGYSDTISLGIYNDQFCTWYAGDQVDIEDFGLGIDQSVFQEFSGTGCIDCSQTDEPPYFNSNSNLCNRVDVTSARCTLSLGSELFATNDTNVTYSDETECAYIESLRVGTYDADGQLYSDSSFGVSRKVTNAQKWLLSISLLVCAVLAVYSCYLHHAITNLLIKSLSHTDLLPPSRHRRRSSSASRRKGRRSRKPAPEEDEDEDFEMKAEATPA